MTTQDSAIPQTATKPPESEAVKSPPPSNAQETPEKAADKKLPILIMLACAVFFSFFLPWFQVRFFTASNISGFDLQKGGGNALLLWIMPILSGLTIFAAMTNRKPQIAAQLAGAAPFAILAYGVYHMGKDLFQILQVGAYVGLAAGLLLFLVPRSMK